MESSGRWDVTERGDLVWRLEIQSPGAYSLGLEFLHYELPEGAQLFLYDRDMQHVYGAYTSGNEQWDHEFVIEPFPGDSVIVEYTQPGDVAGVGQVIIDNVIYDYRDYFAILNELNEVESGAGGEDGGCPLVHVNCSAGDPFPNEKRSTIQTVFGGGLCSAVLINNTNNDGTRYVYTANHCSQGSNTLFRFNYQFAGCGTGGAPQGQTVSGATFLANHPSSDGRLLRINPNIPSSYNVFYSGWSRSQQNPTFGMSMHHPGGFSKKISIDNNGGGKVSPFFQGGIGQVQCWNMDFQTGSTSGGSSGGPLYDQNNRIRGVLTGGPDQDCSVSYYGRLYNFWNNSNIGQFLDPAGTGTFNLDGFDPSGPPPPPPGGSIDITAVAPLTTQAVVVDGPSVITLTGSGFMDATGVSVDGIQLSNFPPEFTVVSDTEIEFNMPLVSKLGNVDIVVDGNNSSGSSTITVTANLTPTLDVVNSDPAFLLSASGIEANMGSLPGHIFFLLLSGVQEPTVIPGLLDIDIGQNATNLFLMTSPGIGASGYATFSVPGGFPAPSPGTQVFWQGAVFNPFQQFPLIKSNVQSQTLLF